MKKFFVLVVLIVAVFMLMQGFASAQGAKVDLTGFWALKFTGGRVQVLGEFGSMIFMAGADSLMTGNYLTTTGRTFDNDLKLIRHQGLRVRVNSSC